MIRRRAHSYGAYLSYTGKRKAYKSGATGKREKADASKEQARVGRREKAGVEGKCSVKGKCSVEGKCKVEGSNRKEATTVAGL